VQFSLLKHGKNEISESKLKNINLSMIFKKINKDPNGYMTKKGKIQKFKNSKIQKFKNSKHKYKNSAKILKILNFQIPNNVCRIVRAYSKVAIVSV
jgi:hypothetical protein